MFSEIIREFVEAVWFVMYGSKGLHPIVKTKMEEKSYKQTYECED